LFEQVFWGKVDATRIARVRQHGRESTGEPQLVIDVLKQNHTGIGRQAATIEVKINCFGPSNSNFGFARGSGLSIDA